MKTDTEIKVGATDLFYGSSGEVPAPDSFIKVNDQINKCQ